MVDGVHDWTHPAYPEMREEARPFPCKSPLPVVFLTRHHCLEAQHIRAICEESTDAVLRRMPGMGAQGAVACNALGGSVAQMCLRGTAALSAWALFRDRG